MARSTGLKLSGSAPSFTLALEYLTPPAGVTVLGDSLAMIETAAWAVVSRSWWTFDGGVISG
jgi:hypothetical protein